MESVYFQQGVTVFPELNANIYTQLCTPLRGGVTLSAGTRRSRRQSKQTQGADADASEADGRLTDSGVGEGRSV